jgi:subtilisin family serine protease
MSPGDRDLLQAPRGSSDQAAPSLAAALDGGAVYAVINIEFKDADSCRQFAVKGAYVVSRFDRFADVLLPTRPDPARKGAAIDPDVQAAIEHAPGIVWAEVDRAVSVPRPLPVTAPPEKPRGLPEPIVRGGIDGLTGKGVIIAIIDSGIDFHHPDFITYDAQGRPTSRLLYFWDTTSDALATGKVGQKAPISYPTGDAIGTVYTRADLTAELRAARPQIATWDLVGHGTQCAGVAAGNGNGDREYTGVAPEADLIAVRIGSESEDLENSWMLGAVCDWIDQLAGGQPVVVSCSWSGQYGSHDGCRIKERRLNARFPDTARGRALCFAAGNEGDVPLHAEVSFAGENDKGTLSWQATAPGSIVVYFDSGEEKLQVDPPRGLGKVRIDPRTIHASLHPITHQLTWEFPVPAGAGGMVLSSQSGKQIKADAYITPASGSFDSACARFRKQVACPATAAQAITVGSYDWNDRFSRRGQAIALPLLGMRDGKTPPLTVGARSFYSNPGPSRLSTPDRPSAKPDIVAPGQYFTAAAPLNSPERPLHETSGKYQLFNGTSAATPYTAGVIALLLQKKPDLTLGEIRELLKANATKDKFTGDLPNPDWGYGKLDLKAVKRMLDAVH